MGILSKKNDDKKNASIMVRMPSGLTEVMDMTAVGNTHSSRPDFVIDGIRSFIRFIVSDEYAILHYLEKKEDVDKAVKVKFYYESLKKDTLVYRNTVVNRIKESRKDVDILLSLPKGLAAEIDRVVERTKCFRNHQEFIKCATLYLITIIASNNTNAIIVNEFLQSNKSTQELEEEIEQMSKELDEMRLDLGPLMSSQIGPEDDDKR